MELGTQIAMLEQALGKLIREWERFFAGGRRTPPQLERDTFGRRLRLVADHGRRPLEQFKLEQLRHRFATYAALWERLLREREEGRGPAVGGAARGVQGGPNASLPSSVDRGGGEDIYQRYTAAKEVLRQPVKVAREAFLQQVEAQREKLEKKLGRRVELDVVVDGDRVKLAARAAAPAKERE